MTNAENDWQPPLTLEEWFKFRILPGSWYMWRLLRKNLRRGEAELHLLPFLCDRTRTSIDVGANKGVYTALMARHSRRVISFEPNPKLFAVLTRALPANAEARREALSDAEGEATMFVPIKKGGFSNQMSSLAPLKGETPHRKMTVRALPLDSLALEDVGFIKIDVEGHEQAVLDGARETLTRCRPTLQIELEAQHTGRPIMDCIAGVEALGYRGFFLENHQHLRPVTAFDPARHHADPARRATYINNFLFFPV